MFSGGLSPHRRAPHASQARDTLLVALFVGAAFAILLQPHVASLSQFGVQATLDHLYGSTVYPRVVIAVNYFEDGFIRRGLPGTLLSGLDADPRLQVFSFIVLSAVCVAIPLGLLSLRLLHELPLRVSAYLIAIVLIAPPLFPLWAGDYARTDLLIEGLLAWSVIAALTNRRWLAIALVLFGLLAHETAYIFGAPLLLALFHHDARSGLIQKRQALILALGVLLGAPVILSLQALLSSPPGAVAARLLSEFPISPDDEQNRLFRDNAIYMAIGGKAALRSALCFNFEIDPRHAVTGGFCIAVLALYAVILPLWMRPGPLVGAVFAPAFFMLVIALDTGRWLGMGVLNAWLLTAFFTLRGQLAMLYDRRWLAVSTLLMVGVFLMGPTTVAHVNRVVKKLTYDGHPYPFEVTIKSWMEHCDPRWQAVVYGPGR